MNFMFYLISLLFICTSSNCQSINNSYSENEEYQDNTSQSPGDYDAYGSGDYDDYHDNIIEFPNFPKCCPKEQAYDLQYKRCIDVMPSDFNYSKIEPNGVYNEHSVQVDITSTITYFPQCKEPYVQKQLLNNEGGISYDDYDYASGIENHPDFLTWFKTKENFWVLVDGRQRRDSSKAHYKDFCIDGYFVGGVHTGMVAFICELPEDLYCKENDCFQQCCPREWYLNPETSTCEKVPDDHIYDWLDEFNATKPREDLNFENVTNMYGTDPENVLHDMLCDEGDKLIDNDLEDNLIKFMSKGRLNINGATIPFGKHCYNQRAHFGDNGVKYSQEIYVCAKDLQNSDYNRWVDVVKQKVIPALFIISLVFLGLLVIHIWRTQRTKLFGWLMLSAIFMLFMFYLFNCLIKLVTPDKLKDGCEISGLIIQYSYMSSVLWLASMSFFMWKSFRRVAPVKAKTQTQVTWGCQHPHFKWYALFSWGIPLIMTIITLILQNSEKILGNNYIKPNIGKEEEGVKGGEEGSTCFLGTKWSQLLYFHIINAPALVANMVFFVMFLWNMLCGVWATQAGDPVVAQQNRQKMLVVIKMFFVMGVTWIAELISFFITWAVDDDKVYRELFFFRLINSLQGLIMFCVIYFDTSRITKIWNWIQTKRGIEIQKEEPSRKMSRVSVTSSKSMASLSEFGRTMKKKLSSASLVTSSTGIELSKIEEARET